MCKVWWQLPLFFLFCLFHTFIITFLQYIHSNPFAVCKYVKQIVLLSPRMRWMRSRRCRFDPLQSKRRATAVLLLKLLALPLQCRSASRGRRRRRRNHRRQRVRRWVAFEMQETLKSLMLPYTEKYRYCFCCPKNYSNILFKFVELVSLPKILGVTSGSADIYLVRHRSEQLPSISKRLGVIDPPADILIGKS